MASYWENRHKKYRGNIKAVGNIGLSESANRADYAQKQAEVERFLNGNFSHLAQKTVWDAGCGQGNFVKLYRDMGFEVFASDLSEEAIQQVRSAYSMEGTHATVGKLHEADFPQVDLVSCLDVLYHVLDDEEWKRALVQFSQKAKVGLLIQEHLEDEASNPNVHIRWRTEKMYEDTLAELGLGLKARKRYTLKQSGSVLDLLYFCPKGLL